MPSVPVSPSGSSWLALGPASDLVGVAPDTLRRWADEGRVEVFRTPGGHRRFRRRSLERLLRRGSPDRTSLADLGATPERLAAVYRRRYGGRTAESPDPLRVVPPTERDVFRVEGRELVAALLHHLDAAQATDRAAALAEASRLVGLLGARLARSGTVLTEAVALFVAARRPFLAELASLGRRRARDPDQLAGLYEDALTVLDGLLLDFIEGHGAAA